MSKHRPLIPLAPVFATRARRAPAPSVLDAGPARLVTSGRIAIANALAEMSIKAGDEVLVPAYHSLSMVPPVLACGARPVFYKVGLDTAVDVADIAALLTPASKVLMVTNYFGFPQNLSLLRDFCDVHGLQLLEDCAHCFFGTHQGRPVGSWGDYAIASSMKFFPIYEGGALVSARHALKASQPVSAGAGFEIKAALNALEYSFSYGRLPLLHALLWLPLKLKDALRSKAPRARDLAPSSSNSSVEFDPSWLDKRSSWFSRMVLRRASHKGIVERRRQHYLQLEQALAGLEGCKPLYAQLPEGACPWMFPLWVDQPQLVFERLLAARVPVTRFAETLWPGVDRCTSSAALSRQVLAFPIHQGLSTEDMRWLAAAVRQAVQP
jgi:perosamine synthetase